MSTIDRERRENIQAGDKTQAFLPRNPDQKALHHLLATLPGVPLVLLELAATPTAPDLPGSPSRYSRDNMAFTLAVQCRARGVSLDHALILEHTLHSLMAQPGRDFYPVEKAEEKAIRVYNSPAAASRRSLGVLPAAFSAVAAPFFLPISTRGDQGRVRKAWEAGVAAFPLAIGEKGGSDTNPTFKTLETQRPTEADWKKWDLPRWLHGNTAYLFGSKAPGVRTLYGIEIENFSSFWDKIPIEQRDWLLANTPIVKSNKSAHIYIEGMDEEAIGSNDAEDPVLGHLEFRGLGKYFVAPGSLHPSNSPTHPMFYMLLNDSVDTILQVTNIRAFAKSISPTFFPKVTTRSEDEEPKANVVHRDSGYSDSIPIDDISVSTNADEDPQGAKSPLASSAEANGYDMEMFCRWSLRSMELLPRPEGMPDLVNTIAKLRDRVAAIERQTYSNTWRNPVNAAVKRQRIFAHLMTKMEMMGLATLYKMEMAADDWAQKRHNALLTKARRLGSHFFWVDNRAWRNSFVYFFSGAMPDAEVYEGLENIAAEISQHIADIDPPEPGMQEGRFRPVGMCKDWKMKRPEDKNKADFIGWRHNVDDDFEVQQCEENGIATWNTEGDPVFEAGRRRFFALGTAAAKDIGEIYSGPAGQWMRLISFIHGKLGYVLTDSAFAEAYPGQENPNKRRKEERAARR